MNVCTLAQDTQPLCDAEDVGDEARGGEVDNGLGNAAGARSLPPIGSDGDARLDHYSRGGRQQAWTGRAKPAALEWLWSALERAGFPTVARHPFPAGSTIRLLAAETGDGARRTLGVEWHAGTTLPGYEEAFTILDAIIGQLSQDAVWRIAAGQPAMVTVIQRAVAKEAHGANP